jgi:site-specific DNA-methyltransferase (adenine-specific)
MKTLKDYEYFRTENGVLYCGDNTEILPLIENCDMVLTDYPYGEVNRNDNGLRNLDKGNADIWNIDTKLFTQTLIKKCNGVFIAFCGYLQLSPIFETIKNDFSERLIIWEKTNPSPMNGEYIYLSGIEKAVYGKRKNATFNAKCKNTVFKHPTEKNETEHPTVKPEKLWIELLKDNSNENQTVLDCFMGSGTTAIACEKLNRRWIGIEISEKYCEIAKKRIEEYTSQLKLFK